MSLRPREIPGTAPELISPRTTSRETPPRYTDAAARESSRGAGEKELIASVEVVMGVAPSGRL